MTRAEAIAHNFEVLMTGEGRLVEVPPPPGTFRPSRLTDTTLRGRPVVDTKPL